MKRLIYILAVVALVVMASGCTADQWSTNKTYSGSGISVTYPGTWNNDTSNALGSFSSGDVLFTVGTNDYTLQVFAASIPQGASATIIQQALQQLKTAWKSIPASLNATVVSDKDLTVDGVSAVQVDFKSTDPNIPEAYLSAVAWVKNDKLYGLVYASKNNDTQTLDRILSSVKST